MVIMYRFVTDKQVLFRQQLVDRHIYSDPLYCCTSGGDINKMDLKKTGWLIAKKRKAASLTLGSLSEQLGVTPQAVHLWETGQRYPDASSQVMIHKVLGLNPVELLTGLEMFDEELKRGVDSYMRRIDEKVFVAGNCKDEDGNDVYVDLSEYSVILKDENGDLGDRWIPYTLAMPLSWSVNKVESRI